MLSDHPGAKKIMKAFLAYRRMKDPEVARKHGELMKKKGHKPKVRGGNGRGIPVPQQVLFNALGEGWVLELAV